MKKVIISRRMYDMASERSITALSRAMESKKDQTGNPEKMAASSSKQEDSSKHSLEISSCKLSVQSGGKQLSEQASTSKPTEQNVASSLLEQASDSKSPERIRSKPAGTLCIYQLVERPIARQLSIEKETIDDLSESRPKEEWVKKLKNLHKDNPKLKLLKHINVGNLFAICYHHPEFRPLVTSIFQVHEFVSSSWSIHEQDVLIRICKDIEAILTEIVSMKSNPHSSSHDIKDKFSRLSWYINEFIDILHLHMDTLHTEKLRFSPFLSASEGRKWFKRNEKAVVHEHRINELIKPKTYLSTTVGTEYLVRISHEHPELLPSIECVLDVNSAMKFLYYEGQIKVFKVIAKVQKFFRQIVQQKEWRTKSSLIEESTENLIDCINESFAEVMTNLSSQCQKLKKTFECGPCQSVSRLVRDVYLKPQQQRLRRKENPHSRLKGVVAFANYGISGDYLKNLETLFHHLVAKRGAYRHVKLYRTAVDWSKITDQHKKYKDKFNENCEQMEINRSHIIRRLDECKEVMIEAREFAERFRKTSFPNPRNLSENFGLNAQLEPFVFDAEDFLTTLDRLISHFLDDLKTFRSLNVSVRKERCSFLLNPQTFAFDFPLC